MEEFLKSYFVQNKQLIFEELGILTLNIIPAYFDQQHQQLFPSYFNYTFSPEKTLKNDTLFFENISEYLNISNEEAQQLYTNFTAHLIANFKQHSSFAIPHLAIVRHVNNAYLVEIDSNLQMVFNPIGVNTKKIKNNTFTISAPIHIPQPQTISTVSIPPPKKQQAIIQVEPVPVAPKKIIVEVAKKQSSSLPTPPKSATKQEEEKLAKNSLPARKKEEHTASEISHQTINRIMIYFFITILLVVIFLVVIKLWIFNDTSFLSSLWK